MKPAPGASTEPAVTPGAAGAMPALGAVRSARDYQSLHHRNDTNKARIVSECASHLTPNGRLVIKDVTTNPAHKLAFTWALDVLMTRGFDMWYWNEQRFHTLLRPYFSRIETYPIADWLPYPHIVYLCDNS